jgi:hypothetical protein
MHDCVLDDPKVQRLDGEVFKVWVNLLCVASRCDGVLPSFEDTAFMLRMDVVDLMPHMKALQAAGLLDDTDDGLAPHKWNERQYKSDVSTDRVKRFRERSTKQDETVSETPPDTEQIQKQNTPVGEQAPALKLVDPPTPEAELYRRGKQVLGQSAGGMIKKLVAAKGGSIAQARAAIETASEKGDPGEYIGAIIRGREHDGRSLRERGYAW